MQEHVYLLTRKEKMVIRVRIIDIITFGIANSPLVVSPFILIYDQNVQ